MVKENLPELGHNELDVMKLLWKKGSLAAREIHETIAASNGWSYSTTRTLLERMVNKNLLSKQDFHGLNLYGARVSKAAGLARLVRNFAEEVLEMELAPVVSLFSRSEALTVAELAELQAILDAGDEQS